MPCNPTTSWATQTPSSTTFKAGCASPSGAGFTACAAPAAAAWGCASPDDAAATSLQITTQPAGSNGGVALTTQPVVRVLDQYGNLFPVDGLTVNVVSDTGAMSGTTDVNTVGGVATFTDLLFADLPWVPARTTVLRFSAPGVSGVASALLTLALGNNLGAWWRADSTRNTFNASATPELQIAADLSGHSKDLTLAAGVIKTLRAALNGVDGLDFSTAGANYLSNVVIPVQGSFTWFGVFKITSSGAYQNLFDTQTDAQSWLFWDQPTNKWQLDGRLAGSGVAGAYLTFVVHFSNSGGALQILARVNGTQILSQQATAPATPLLGSVGNAVDKTFNMFNRTGGLTFSSQLLEWGFFTLSQAGSEGGVNGPETYLRAQYATW